MVKTMKAKAPLLFFLLLTAVFIQVAKASSENVIVNGFDKTYTDWAEAPALDGNAYLDSDDADTSYISTNTNAVTEGFFSFADTTFTTITDVHLYFKARFVTATSDNNFDAYNSSNIFLGNVIPTTTSYAVYQADPSYTTLDYLNTPAKVNAFTCYVKFYRVASSTRTIRITYAYLTITGTTGGGTTYTHTQTLGITTNAHTKTIATIRNVEHASLAFYSTAKIFLIARNLQGFAVTSDVTSTNSLTARNINHATCNLNAIDLAQLFAQATQSIDLLVTTYASLSIVFSYLQYADWTWLMNSETAMIMNQIQISSIAYDGNQVNVHGMINGQEVTIAIQQTTPETETIATYPIVTGGGGIIQPIITPEIEATFLYVPYCQLTLTGLIKDEITVATNFQIKNKQNTPTTGTLTARLTRLNAAETLNNKTVDFSIPRNNQTIIPLIMNVPRNLGIFTEQYFLHITIEYQGTKTTEAIAYFKPQIETLPFLIEAGLYSSGTILLILGIWWFLTNVEIHKHKKEE